VSNMENLPKKALLASKGCKPYHNLNYLPSSQPLCVWSLKDVIVWYFVFCRLIKTSIRLASWAVHSSKMFGGDSDGDSPEGSQVKLGRARVSSDAHGEMGLDLENRKVLSHYL
jgi:hypothetical protein